MGIQKFIDDVGLLFWIAAAPAVYLPSLFQMLGHPDLVRGGQLG